MKKLLLILVFVIVSALMFNYSALAKNSPGPAPSSGDGISDGGLDGHFGDDGDSGEGPAPNSGDGVSDGSGMEGGHGDDGDDD